MEKETETDMLVIEDDCIYEVDEECLMTHKMPKDCDLPEEVWEHTKEERLYISSVKNQKE